MSIAFLIKKQRLQNKAEERITLSRKASLQQKSGQLFLLMISLAKAK